MDLDRLEDIQDVGPDWSVSRLQTIYSCGKKYEYKYVARVEEPPTPPLAFGSAVHRCIERMHWENKWEEGQLQRMWGDEWYAARVGIDWEATNYREHTQNAKGMRILEAYAVKHREDEWLALEANFRFDPFPFAKEYKSRHSFPMLRGTFDKVQRLTAGEDVPPEFVGRLAIIDYKTGKNPPDKLLLAVDPQLTIYHQAAKELLGEDVVLAIHHLPSEIVESKNNPPPSIFWTTRTDGSMDVVLEMIREGVERVENAKFERNISYACKWCAYKESCLGGLVNSGKLDADRIVS